MTYNGGEIVAPVPIMKMLRLEDIERRVKCSDVPLGEGSAHRTACKVL
jgi:hypothetical protein